MSLQASGPEWAVCVCVSEASAQICVLFIVYRVCITRQSVLQLQQGCVQTGKRQRFAKRRLRTGFAAEMRDTIEFEQLIRGTFTRHVLGSNLDAVYRSLCYLHRVHSVVDHSRCKGLARLAPAALSPTQILRLAERRRISAAHTRQTLSVTCYFRRSLLM